MPYRREPVSPGMTACMQQVAEKASQGNLVSATWDWFVLSQYKGFWIAEFAQRVHNRADCHITNGGKKTSKAFNSSDFVFYDDMKKTVSPEKLEKYQESIDQVAIRWRVKKKKKWRKNYLRQKIFYSNTQPT